MDETKLTNTEYTEDDSQDNNNNLDMTYIQEDDEPINYDGIEENHYEEDYGDEYTSTAALKRNLSATFEKHAKEDEDHIKMKRERNDAKKSKDGIVQEGPTKRRGGVQAKIQAFEQKNMIIKPKNHGGNSKVRFDASNHSRPPTAPVPQKLQLGSDNKQLSLDTSSLLSVYLRIRPPTASNDALEEDYTAGQNTVEVVSSTNSNDPSTIIRTYPPLQSNASKVVRGGNNHLHNSSHNTDLIFTGSNKNLVDSAVKGVKEFNFNQVFGVESTQEEIYNDVATPLVDGLFPKDNVKIPGDKLVGKSALLFSYGITNAGKTYTIMGQDGSASATIVEESHGNV